MKINHKNVVVDGHLFDSQTEADYYKHLKSREDIVSIELQPKFTLLNSFNVICSKCQGRGKIPSPKTGNLIKCQTCDGRGQRKRQEWTYKADFEVRYKDGHFEVIDVKGKYGLDKQFPLKRKMWESKYKQELIVAEWDKKKRKWVYR